MSSLSARQDSRAVDYTKYCSGFTEPGVTNTTILHRGNLDEFEITKITLCHSDTCCVPNDVLFTTVDSSKTTMRL